MAMISALKSSYGQKQISKQLVIFILNQISIATTKF